MNIKSSSNDYTNSLHNSDLTVYLSSIFIITISPLYVIIVFTALEEDGANQGTADIIDIARVRNSRFRSSVYRCDRHAV